MSTEHPLTLQTRDILLSRGAAGLTFARQVMSEEKIANPHLKAAVQYFMGGWEDVLHPALLSLSCAAVGGNPEETSRLGAALVLLAGGADLHDDIIDQSTTKNGKPTVYGKFGAAVTILAGDALLFRGIYLLHDACENLPPPQKQRILSLVNAAFLEISNAEATETTLHHKTDSAATYLEMIKRKAAVSKTTTQIGAILAGGSPSEVEALGFWGETFGVLYTLRDEFVDLFDLVELKNRYVNETLPLPILYTFRDPLQAEHIRRLLDGMMTEKEHELLLDLVMDSKETGELKEQMQVMIKNASVELGRLKYCKSELTLLLDAMLEDL
jgi:geranylgeranyl pyrophosphate synthase